METACIINGKNVLVSGACGLIGRRLVGRLVADGAHVIAVVRDEDRARRILGSENNIEYLVSDVQCLPEDIGEIDYIVHAAAMTSSQAFINDPVGVIITSVVGTKRMLDIARENSVKAFVYLSSMEVYGAPDTDSLIDETHESNLDTMEVRSSYPESKRLCECLCTAYASQYGVPAKVIRLTQTFGPGVEYDDGRVFAEFARCAIEGRDIVLQTKGDTKRSYLHVDDAVEGILTVLLHGKIGQAYNAANPSTYCSILEMASLVARDCTSRRISVRINSDADIAAMGYAPTLHMNLNTEKLESLGWKAKVGLRETFIQTIESMKLQKTE